MVIEMGCNTLLVLTISPKLSKKTLTFHLNLINIR